MLKEQKEVLARIAEQMAYSFEKTYHGCSQAVVRAVMHALGIHEEAVFAAAFPMAGGIAARQETCGALIGGLMCLGMASKKYGRSWEEHNKWNFDQLMDSVFAAAGFFDRCKDAIGGSASCREITGMDMKSKDDALKFAETPNFETCCQNCGKVAKMVVETLLEEDL